MAQTGFENVLNDAEFAERSFLYWSRVEEALVLAAAKMPATGAFVSAIVPGSEAESIAIQPGDVVSQIGEQIPWGGVPWRRRTGPAELVVFSPKAVKSVHEVAPGIVGFYSGGFDSSELDLIRALKGKDGPWMKFAVLGQLLWNENPDLSAASWARAMQNGYAPDLFSDFCLLMHSLPLPQLESRLEQYIEKFPDGTLIPHCFLEGLTSAATACGNIMTLERIAKQQGIHNHWSVEELRRLAEFKSRSELSDRDLLSYVRSRPYRIIGSELQTDPAYKNKSGISNVEIFQGSTNYVSVGQNNLKIAVAKDIAPLKNVHLSFSISQMAISQVSNKFSNFLGVGFISGAVGSSGTASKRFPPASVTLLSAGVEFIPESLERMKVPHFKWSTSGFDAIWRTQASRHFGTKTLSNNQDTIALDNLFFDLIRLDSEVACYVNDICYLRMPVDPAADDLSVFFMLSGCHLDSVDCLVRRIDDN